MVEDIAEEAGIGKGTIYLYFDSKQKIFWDMVFDDCQQMSDATRAQVLGEEVSWREAVQSFMQLRLDYCERNPHFMRLLLTEVYGILLQSKPIDPRLPSLVQEAEYQIQQMFAVAIAKKQIRRVDPALPTRVVLSLMRGLLELQLKGSSRDVVQQQMQFDLDMLAAQLETRD